MRHWILPLASLLTHCLAGQIVWDKGSIDRISSSEARGHACLPKGGGTAGPARGYDVTYQRLHVLADPAVNAIAGVVTHHFIALEDLPEIKLDLSSAFSIDYVLYHGSAIGSDHVNDTLTIAFPATITEGLLDSVTIHYSGTPPETGFGSFVQTEHAGVPVIWTLSEPYGAKDWWPCKQDLKDKSDSLDVLITTPTGFRAVSNGLLVNELEEGGHTVFHWRHRYPIAYYLVAFAVTNYVTDHSQIVMPEATVPMETWSYPEDAAAMHFMVSDVQQQMPFFSEMFGLYPFAEEKYGHAQFGWGGGMEHQTISFMGAVSYELSAHELAHQWFGDKVTCASWQDLWLNEGFATYLQGLCYDFLGPEYWHGWKAAQIDNIVSEPDGSVFVTDTNDIGRLFSSRLTYRKGAFVLHMLRWIMGDDAFFEGCRNYLNDPELAYSSARTADLKAHFEAVSEMDLTGFFADWYYGEGHPMYQLEWSQDGSGVVTASLSQTPSHSSVDFFELPVPIRFSNAIEDTTVVFDHTFSGEVFTVELSFTPTLAELDPELWLISGQNAVLPVADRNARHQIFLHPNPVAEELAVQLNNVLSGMIEIRIHDASGRIIHSEKLAGTPSDNIKIDTLTLNAGPYVLEVITSTFVANSRFIKR